MRLNHLLALIALLPALLVPCAVRVCVCTAEAMTAACCAHCCAEDVPACCREAVDPLPAGPRVAPMNSVERPDCCLTFHRDDAPITAEARASSTDAPFAGEEPIALPTALACDAPSRPAPPMQPNPAPPLLRGAGLPLLI